MIGAIVNDLRDGQGVAAAGDQDRTRAKGQHAVRTIDGQASAIDFQGVDRAVAREGFIGRQVHRVGRRRRVDVVGDVVGAEGHHPVGAVIGSEVAEIVDVNTGQDGVGRAQTGAGGEEDLVHRAQVRHAAKIECRTAVGDAHRSKGQGVGVNARVVVRHVDHKRRAVDGKRADGLGRAVAVTDEVQRAAAAGDGFRVKAIGCARIARAVVEGQSTRAIDVDGRRGIAAKTSVGTAEHERAVVHRGGSTIGGLIGECEDSGAIHAQGAGGRRATIDDHSADEGSARSLHCEGAATAVIGHVDLARDRQCRPASEVVHQAAVTATVGQRASYLDIVCAGEGDGISTEHHVVVDHIRTRQSNAALHHTAVEAELPRRARRCQLLVQNQRSLAESEGAAEGVRCAAHGEGGRRMDGDVPGGGAGTRAVLNRPIPDCGTIAAVVDGAAVGRLQVDKIAIDRQQRAIFEVVADGLVVVASLLLNVVVDGDGIRPGEDRRAVVVQLHQFSGRQRTAVSKDGPVADVDLRGIADTARCQA